MTKRSSTLRSLKTSWKKDLIFAEESFALLQNILEDSGVLKERVPYEELVTKEFAQKAAE